MVRLTLVGRGAVLKTVICDEQIVSSSLTLTAKSYPDFHGDPGLYGVITLTGKGTVC